MAVQASSGSLQTLEAWALYLAGTAIAAFLGQRLLGRTLEWVRARRKRVRLRTVLLTALTLVVLTAVSFAVPPVAAIAQITLFGCAHPVELRVLTSPDDLESYRQVADDYERYTAEGNHDCRTANVSIDAATPEHSIEGLSAGWSPEYLRDYGPRPDVWLTDSIRQVGELRTAAQASNTALRIEDVEEVAWSPLVLGVPVAVAQNLGGVDRKAMKWQELLRKVEQAGLGVVRPYPTGLSIGDLAADILYTGEDGALVKPRRAREVEQWVGRSADSGRFPLAGSALLLRAHRESTDPRTTLIVPEQALIRSNAAARVNGRSQFPGCDSKDAPPGCLLAFYPTDTFRVQYSFTRLLWGTTSEESLAQTAARGFGEWLRQREGREALNKVGLRPSLNQQNVGSPIDERFGALPGPRTDKLRNPPDLARRANIQQLYASAQRRARVLLALDSSGSMATVLGHGKTRFEVAVRGVQESLKLLGKDDEFGMSVFSGAGSAGVRVVTPIGPRDEEVDGNAM